MKIPHELTDAGLDEIYLKSHNEEDLANKLATLQVKATMRLVQVLSSINEELKT